MTLPNRPSVFRVLAIGAGALAVACGPSNSGTTIEVPDASVMEPIASGSSTAGPESESDLADYESRCEAGNARACYGASQWYRAPVSGVPRDGAKGLQLLESGCGLGSVEACNGLAHELRAGTLTPVDQPRALVLLERACTADYGKACFNLADMYSKGESVGVDAAEAGRLTERACELGYSPGCSTQ